MAEVVRIADKTWKKDFHTCIVCEEVIPEGVSFRLKTTKAESSETAQYQYEGAHTACVDKDPAWAPFEFVPADKGLGPVREARGHRFRVGAAVVLHGLPAVITGGAGGRVEVLQNGVARTVDNAALQLT